MKVEESEWGGDGRRCRFCFFFFKQKTAYEIVSRDWSSDVCSSDLPLIVEHHFRRHRHNVSVLFVFKKAQSGIDFRFSPIIKKNSYSSVNFRVSPLAPFLASLYRVVL